ncbi:MAG: N-acetylmuramoyl-L-alanine amidase [Gemmatimonadetes bacterium]|nr:N-acetylmuramoyl-L-alanine amidase [Gemmatimonadota bacterium]
MVVFLWGCSAGVMTPLSPPAPVRGPLGIQVAYPPPQGSPLPVTDGSLIPVDSLYVIGSADSVFIYGSVGRGDARLTVNGREVPVYPTGGWIAWLAVPEESVARFRLVAIAGGDTARAIFEAPIAPRFVPPELGVWIDTAALAPRGDRWVRPGEGYALSVRAVPGASVRAIGPGGDTLVFLPDSAASPRAWGSEAFDTGRPGTPVPLRDRYVAWQVGAFGPDPGHVMSPWLVPPPEDSAWVWLEVARKADTARYRWPLRVGVIEGGVPPVVVVDDDTALTGETDRILAGRPVPSGTYHWFFPNGTMAVVSGRQGDQVRLQLSRRSVAWVDAVGVIPLQPGTPPPGGVARSMRLVPGAGWVTLRVPLSRRIPFRVDEAGRRLVVRLYGVAADMDWIQYGGTDPFVRLIEFGQPAGDEVEITVHLAESVWGYRTRWVGSDLLLEIRRPPGIDPGAPLRGRRIALDPGHPPGGSRGPTGVAEAQVTLEVARKLQTLLERAGADVVMIRDGVAAVGLIERTTRAEAADAEILVSIHANAVPDGVNPFVNSGTSVYYYHPRAAELAREINRGLVRHLGFRDLGVGRGDLHLARPTWMPSVLVEGLFIMLPDQEAVLTSDEGQWRYARGVHEGIERFLLRRLEEPG